MHDKGLCETDPKGNADLHQASALAQEEATVKQQQILQLQNQLRLLQQLSQQEWPRFSTLEKLWTSFRGVFVWANPSTATPAATAAEGNTSIAAVSAGRWAVTAVATAVPAAVSTTACNIANFDSPSSDDSSSSCGATVEAVLGRFSKLRRFPSPSADTFFVHIFRN